MLTKLSLRNAKRQAKDYLVYFTTVTLVAALLYAFNALVVSEEIRTLSTMLRSLPVMVTLSSIAVVFIMGWLVFYITRFMLSKRSRELGTYILLGIEPRRVAGMFMKENLMIGGFAFLLGLLVGNLISQVLRAVLLNLFGIAYAFQFGFSPLAILLAFAYLGLIFGFSLMLCRKRIRKMKIHDLICYDRQNEGEILANAKGRRKLFILSVVCGVIGVALMATRSAFPVIIGALLTIFFCYGFFISFSSGIPAWYDKRPRTKYKGIHLPVFRLLSSKLSSVGITMGTIAVMNALGGVFDAGIIANTAHLWSMIGITLGMFGLIYLIYVLTSYNSMKRNVMIG